MRQTLGEDNPQIWFALSGSGVCILKLGDPVKAYGLLKRVDDIIVKTYGEQHPIRKESLKYLNEAKEAVEKMEGK